MHTFKDTSVGETFALTFTCTPAITLKNIQGTGKFTKLLIWFSIIYIISPDKVLSAVRNTYDSYDGKLI